MGKTLAELRAALLPGELNLHRADAELHGPWWEERGDVLAAAVMHTVASCAAKKDLPFESFQVKWGPPAAPLVLDWETVAPMLAARYCGSQPPA